MFCRACHVTLSHPLVSDLLLSSFEFVFFFPSCLMTTPCQWFKLVTGFVLVTMVAQTGVCSLWKNNIFLSCHMLTERGQCVFSLFYTFQVMQNDDTE